MQAIILAAGMGRRLGELTRNNTKCMVRVNGVALIDRLLNQLVPLNLRRVVIVVGYEGPNCAMCGCRVAAVCSATTWSALAMPWPTN